jgi:hypothetical protein
MKLRSFTSIAIAGLLVVIVVSLWMMRDRPIAVPPPETPLTAAPRPAPASIPALPVAMAMPAPEIPADLPPPKPRVVASPEALKDIEDVQFMLRDFRTRLGGNPEGTNREIMKAVMGGNPVQARLGPPDGQNLNEKGELVDRWGAPYFFHQLSKNEMEVRSAGPDGTMWTADDILLK